jgi:hypothetical protein
MTGKFILFTRLELPIKFLKFPFYPFDLDQLIMILGFPYRTEMVGVPV